MYRVKFSSRYKKSFKRYISNKSFNKKSYDYVIETLMLGDTLDLKHRDHALKGELLGYRECHISPDILLIYQHIDDELILHLIDIGSHSELF